MALLAGSAVKTCYEATSQVNERPVAQICRIFGGL